MDFTFGLITSNEQVLLQQFSTEKDANSNLVDIADLKEQDIQALLYLKDFSFTDELKVILEREHKYYPITSKFSQSIEHYKNWTIENAKTALLSIRETWLLHNNLTLLENLFDTLKYLNQLWPNHRSKFFKELWSLLRSNIGSKTLKIIYNDLESTHPNSDKNKLVRCQVDGIRDPELLPGSSLENQLMDSYQSLCVKNFDIAEYNPQKGEIVIVGKINESPVIIMATIFQINQIQRALLKALFEGFEYNINN